MKFFRMLFEWKKFLFKKPLKLGFLFFLSLSEFIDGGRLGLEAEGREQSVFSAADLKRDSPRVSGNKPDRLPGAPGKRPKPPGQPPLPSSLGPHRLLGPEAGPPGPAALGSPPWAAVLAIQQWPLGVWRPGPESAGPGPKPGPLPRVPGAGWPGVSPSSPARQAEEEEERSGRHIQHRASAQRLPRHRGPHHLPLNDDFFGV